MPFELPASVGALLPLAVLLLLLTLVRNALRWLVSRAVRDERSKTPPRTPAVNGESPTDEAPLRRAA